MCNISLTSKLYRSSSLNHLSFTINFYALCFPYFIKIYIFNTKQVHVHITVKILVNNQYVKELLAHFLISTFLDVS